MKNHRRGWLRYGVMLALVAVLGFGPTPLSERRPGVIPLAAPEWVGVASAETGAVLAGLADEAGISAYFNKGSAINLNQVRGLYRTIELDTGTYLLGSMQATGIVNYPESQDVHVYISASGWVMAYYLKTDPTAKIADVSNYSGGSTINTKLDIVLGRVAVAASTSYVATYYDFRAPNATKLMLVADYGASGANDSFQVNLPGTLTYYERSWSHASPGCAYLYLDGVQVGAQVCGATVVESGFFTPVQLAVDTTHLVEVRYSCCGVSGTGVVAIVYRDIP